MTYRLYRSHGMVNRKDCFVCHDERAQLLGDRAGRRRCSAPSATSARRPQKFVHGPVAIGSCTVCHDPHGQTNPAFLVASGEALCFRCHTEADALKHLTMKPGAARRSCGTRAASTATIRTRRTAVPAAHQALRRRGASVQREPPAQRPLGRRAARGTPGRPATTPRAGATPRARSARSRDEFVERPLQGRRARPRLAELEQRAAPAGQLRAQRVAVEPRRTELLGRPGDADGRRGARVDGPAGRGRRDDLPGPLPRDGRLDPVDVPATPGRPPGTRARRPARAGSPRARARRPAGSPRPARGCARAAAHPGRETRALRLDPQRLQLGVADAPAHRLADEREDRPGCPGPGRPPRTPSPRARRSAPPAPARARADRDDQRLGGAPPGTGTSASTTAPGRAGPDTLYPVSGGGSPPRSRQPLEERVASGRPASGAAARARRGTRPRRAAWPAAQPAAAAPAGSAGSGRRGTTAGRRASRSRRRRARTPRPCRGRRDGRYGW